MTTPPIDVAEEPADGVGWHPRWEGGVELVRHARGTDYGAFLLTGDGRAWQLEQRLSSMYSLEELHARRLPSPWIIVRGGAVLAGFGEEHGGGVETCRGCILTRQLIR